MDTMRFGDEVKVLLVEDEPADAEREIDALQACGLASIRVVQTGEEAVDAVTMDPPDVALVDLHMPGMTGVELTRRLRRMRRCPAIVMLTGTDDPGDVREAFRAGAQDYLCKAELDATQVESTLARVIAAVLDQRRARMLREEIVSVVAHDLMNPLANVVANAELLCEELAPGQPAVRRILSNAAYMRQLVEGTLVLSRLESGADPVAGEPCPLRALLSGAVDRNGILASQKRISLDLDMAAGDSPLIGVAGVQQVINNLIANAIKFSPPGSVVRLGASAETGTVRIWVQDQGPGIPVSEFEHLFERFAKGSARPTAAEPGFGLGLHIVFRIVTLHGGTIEVASEPGGGSRFTVVLPAARR